MTWAAVDADGVVLAVLHGTQERAERRAQRLVGVAGVRDLADLTPTPSVGWRYERETKTWTPPSEEQP